jgi:hypothetical protein
MQDQAGEEDIPHADFLPGKSKKNTPIPHRPAAHYLDFPNH